MAERRVDRQAHGLVGLYRTRSLFMNWVLTEFLVPFHADFSSNQPVPLRTFSSVLWGAYRRSCPGARRCAFPAVLSPCLGLV